jgi:hypothetical protein
MHSAIQTCILVLIAAVLTAFTIVGHEVAHYLGAVAMGAENVRLHWADITFDEGSLGNTGAAITWAAGPICTHGIIVLVLVSKSSQFYALALGLGAASRNLVLLPFTIKLLLGRDVGTFTNDEVTVADAMATSPLGLALLAAFLGVLGTFVFLLRAQRVRPIVWPIALIVGTIGGIVLWGVFGAWLLPGGKGFN